MRVGWSRPKSMRIAGPVFAAIALFVGTAAAIRHVRYLNPTLEELALEISQRHAVVVAEAEIKRDEPPLGGLVKSSCIILVKPSVSRWLPLVRQKCTIVIGDDEFFVDDVRLAIENRKELDSDWYAIMGASVRIIDLSPGGKPSVVGHGDVNFIEIRSTGNTTSP